jgi:glutathione S-transferase
MSELVFYTHPMSRGRIIRWMLEEVGQPYRTELLGFGASMKDPAYLAINPMGKVPAILHGETVVTECAAICAYLADAFPQANLAPPHGDKRRGPYSPARWRPRSATGCSASRCRTTRRAWSATAATTT